MYVTDEKGLVKVSWVVIQLKVSFVPSLPCMRVIRGTTEHLTCKFFNHLITQSSRGQTPGFLLTLVSLMEHLEIKDNIKISSLNRVGGCSWYRTSRTTLKSG